jgi:hypothetical protein
VLNNAKGVWLDFEMVLHCEPSPRVPDVGGPPRECRLPQAGIQGMCSDFTNTSLRACRWSDLHVEIELQGTHARCEPCGKTRAPRAAVAPRRAIQGLQGAPRLQI